ncbi:MAG: two-component sensor histidine kinase [Acidimicrobiales bacterium]|nr:two-component sensor histidine kinase [Acidimicrobiales bacterium]
MPEGPTSSPGGPRRQAAASPPGGPRSDSQLRLLAESLPHIVWMARPDGSVDYFNRQGADFVGGQPEDAHGGAWAALIHPDDIDHVRRKWQRSIASGDPFDDEYRIRAADGSYRLHWCRASPIRGSRAEIVKWIGTATDIEDRRRREDHPTGHDQGVLRFGDLAIDLSSREVWLRQQPVELTRREFDLLSHLVLERGRTITREHLLEVAWSSSARWQTAATITEHVRRLRLKLEEDPSDPRLIVTVRGTGYRFDPPDEPHRLALPDESIQSAPEAMFLLRGVEVISANPAMLEVLAVSCLAEIVGRPIYEFIAPRSLDAARIRLERIQAGSWPRPEVLTLTCSDGQHRTVEVASAPVVWSGEPVSQVTVWPTAPPGQIHASADAAVIVASPDFSIQSFNPAAESLYGWSEDEVVGQSVLDVIPWAGDPGRVADAAEELRRDGRWHGHAPQVRRDGSVVVVDASVTLLRDLTGQVVGIIAVNRAVLSPSSTAAPAASNAGAGEG